MFYQEQHDPALRFGDIIGGFYSAIPTIKDPSTSFDKDNYKLDISLSPFFAIMSPCCSIRDKVISLTPLLPLRKSFFLNEYFLEDLTRINRIMEPEQKFSKKVWDDELKPEDKQKVLEGGSSYTVLEVFIYQNHPLLPQYTIPTPRESIKCDYYMIDFRNSFRTNCDKINAPEQAPRGSKILQLTPQTRKELRHKMSNFYGKVPDEDRPFVTD